LNDPKDAWLIGGTYRWYIQVLLMIPHPKPLHAGVHLLYFIAIARCCKCRGLPCPEAAAMIAKGFGEI
jgi:hypothetical protein